MAIPIDFVGPALRATIKPVLIVLQVAESLARVWGQLRLPAERLVGVKIWSIVTFICVEGFFEPRGNDRVPLHISFGILLLNKIAS